MFREKKSALAKATDLLANQEQSSTVLRRKLLARKYDATEVDAALAELGGRREGGRTEQYAAFLDSVERGFPDTAAERLGVDAPGVVFR